MRAVVLDGVGFDHIGLHTIPTPRPNANQLLARVDAAGICTSLIKIAAQGPKHTLINGWDVTQYPLILGDEGAVTLVEVGANLQDRYQVGQRFATQPTIAHAPINHRERYHNHGEGMTRLGVGYTIGGHLTEYILITEEILAADCLVPLPDDSMTAAHAALSEPLACVICGQDHHLHLVQDNPLSERRVIKGLKPGGVTVIVGCGAMGRMHVDLALSYRPRLLIATDYIEERLARVRDNFSQRAHELGIELQAVNAAETDARAFIHSLTDGRGADDVIVAVGAAQAVETAQAYVGSDGVLNLFGGLKKGEDVVPFDTDLIHYKSVSVTGSSGGSPYDMVRTLDLMAAGEIDAGAHITHIGDLNHAVEFLRMVKDREIDGKAVVYPHRPAESIQVVDSWSADDERAYLAACES
jgi:threonine dehydrogenase-like Zn-dependent dehydrogenase